MEHLNEGPVVGVDYLVGYALGNQPRVVVDADDRILAGELAREFVTACLVYPDLSALRLVGEHSFADEGLDEVFYVAALADENIILVLPHGQRCTPSQPSDGESAASLLRAYLFRDPLAEERKHDVLLGVELG